MRYPTLDHAALPAHGPLRATPEHALCAAILAQAFRDVRHWDPQIAGEAQRWFAQGPCTWVCEVLGLDPALVQARAVAWAQER